MTKNIKKYMSYAEAWRRINASIAQGFYFEAVTLCESIISDRILSYVLGVDGSSKANTQTAFKDLIRMWRKCAGSLPAYDNHDLGEAADAWRLKRNSIVHGLTKSMPGSPTKDLNSFLETAEKAANDGKELARKVSDWHKQEKRKISNKSAS